MVRMAAWKSRAHLDDHFGQHRGELRVRSIAEYDKSAQDTIILGTRFTYVDRDTCERRIGYFHRDSARFTATTVDGQIVTHFQADEGYAADLLFSTYED
jgi:hypothetical protein